MDEDDVYVVDLKVKPIASSPSEDERMKHDAFGVERSLLCLFSSFFYSLLEYMILSN